MRGIEAINQKRVLLIGDDPSEMRRLGEMIAAQGLQVVQTADIRLGLRLARQQHPDLIVLHIESSGMSPLAVAQHLKADTDTRGIPLVVITGCAKERQEELHAEVFTDLIALLLHRRRLPIVSRLLEKGCRSCGNLR
jgi:two-component system, cell cycle response regulator DivK